MAAEFQIWDHLRTIQTSYLNDSAAASKTKKNATGWHPAPLQALAQTPSGPPNSRAVDENVWVWLTRLESDNLHARVEQHVLFWHAADTSRTSDLGGNRAQQLERSQRGTRHASSWPLCCRFMNSKLIFINYIVGRGLGSGVLENRRSFRKSGKARVVRPWWRDNLVCTRFFCERMDGVVLVQEGNRTIN